MEWYVMEDQSAFSVTVRLGRKQTPYTYRDLETVQRDLEAANVRTAQLKRDWTKAAADAMKLSEAHTLLAQKLAVLAEKRRAREETKRAEKRLTKDVNEG